MCMLDSILLWINPVQQYIRLYTGLWLKRHQNMAYCTVYDRTVQDVNARLCLVCPSSATCASSCKDWCILLSKEPLVRPACSRCSDSVHTDPRFDFIDWPLQFAARWSDAWWAWRLALEAETSARSWACGRLLTFWCDHGRQHRMGRLARPCTWTLPASESCWHNDRHYNICVCYPVVLAMRQPAKRWDKQRARCWCT